MGRREGLAQALNFPIPARRIAELIGCPAVNVEKHWPLIEQCLDALSMGSRNNCIAVLATVAVECPPFKPVKEYGGDAYLNKMYDTRKDLGNTPEKDGDGAKYAGRGFIQTTGKSNYERAGILLGVDLLSEPDKALEPNASAALLAAYWYDKGIAPIAEARQWERVRRKVNGGINGLSKFLKLVSRLEKEVYGSDQVPA